MLLVALSATALAVAGRSAFEAIAPPDASPTLRPTRTASVLHAPAFPWRPPSLPFLEGIGADAPVLGASLSGSYGGGALHWSDLVVADSLAVADSLGLTHFEDPTGGGVPLRWVGDRDAWLSPGFKLRDFVPRDDAPLIRIAPDLVAALERLRERAGDVRILSGYRHPAYNTTVGGVAQSQHTAGKAADVWSPRHPPQELARLALLSMGCDIGVGLGAHTVHVDVRGELATWTYEAAPLNEPAFDAWALTLCGRPVPPALAQEAAAFWMERPAPGAPEDEAPPSPPYLSPEDLLRLHASAIARVVARGRAADGPGGVLLEVMPDAAPVIRYVRAGSPEADRLALQPLIAWCQQRAGDYLAYAVVRPEGTDVGVTSALALTASAEAQPAPAPASEAPGDEGPPEAAPRPAPAASGFAVVTASFVSEADAEADARAVRRRLGTAAFVLPAPAVDRFRVALGPYASAEAARAALERFGASVPQDAWVTSL